MKNADRGYGLLAQWFETTLGVAVLDLEQDLVNETLVGFLGARQLECGLAVGVSVVKERKGWLQWQAIPQAPTSPSPEPVHSMCFAQPQELPMADDELDVVVLHHTLDLTPFPHASLREAARVLRPGGQLLLVGFNPWSLWGIRRFLGRAKEMPWQAGFLRPQRLTDWLRLLDFAVDSPQYRFFRPPTQNARLLSRLAFMERLPDHGRSFPGGAFYVLTAEKKRASMIRLDPLWEPRRNVVTMPLANRPASRHSER